MNVSQRFRSESPKFWQKVKRVSMVIGAVGGALLAAPVVLPAGLVTGITVIVSVSGALAVASSATIKKDE